MTNFNFDPKEFYFIPLGGSEQFGVNLNVYGYEGKWLAVDCGIGFADEKFPNIDLLLPDPTFLEERRKDLVGLIVTHAHEDHVGAVPYLWPRLKCPVYCSAFTAAVLEDKIQDFPECRDMEINVVRAGNIQDLRPFKVQYAHVAHSIPETFSLVIETKAGRIVHSGDWNLDPRPVLSEPTQAGAFREAGKKGVIAYIGDSTNAEVDGRSGSESDVEKGLKDLFAECEGRIVVTAFASNIGRIRSVAKAAKGAGRSVAIIGRSLHRMVGAARDCGYLRDVGDFVSEGDIGVLPDSSVVMIVTGSQGEARAQLARIARGDHPEISLKKGDTVIFSARPIPGNEKEIIAVKNNLAATGVTTISPHDTKHCIHVSGHPAREEIEEMLGWVKPGCVIPVHGERTMLEAHAELARKCQIKTAIVPCNGSIIRLAPGTPEVLDHIEAGLLAVEPGRILAADHDAINQRRKLQFSGTIHITLVMNAKGDLMDRPRISTVGLVDNEGEEGRRFDADVAREIDDILADLTREELRDDKFISEEIRIGTRRFVDHLLRIKPKTTVHLVRL